LAATDKEKIFDIEFLGGTSVQIELKADSAMDDEDVRRHITAESESAMSWLKSAAGAIRQANVTAGAVPGEYKIVTTDLTPEEVESLVRPVAEDLIERGGFSMGGAHETIVRTKPEAEVTAESFKVKLNEAGDYADNAARRLASARVQSVADVGTADGSKHRTYEIVTIESNKQLVRSAILGALGDDLQIERPISYRLVRDATVAPNGAWPIGEVVDGRPVRELQDVIGGTAPYNIEDYKGGLVMVFDELDPLQTTEQIERRVREMRLQPGFEQFAWKPFEVIGLVSSSEKAGDETLYSKIALVTVDENLLYFDNPERWVDRVAEPELEAAAAALSSEKSLRKVVQFAPTIANQAQQSASVAMVLALAAIVAYVWIRFGTIQYGLAAIVALVHDVMITLGLIALSDFVFATFIGKIFRLADFKIDLAMVAALLTIVGYSLNDTIVVFDRIRENRGRMGRLNANLINGSINQTLSRTFLTSGTTLISVLFMYLMGGPGVHGFAFAMLMGILVGTYSSIAIASPLLYRPALLHSVIYVIAALGAIGLIYVIFGNVTSTLVVAAIAAVAVAVLIRGQFKSHRPQPQPA
jgi:preprotein translocase SecF subunit